MKIEFMAWMKYEVPPVSSMLVWFKEHDIDCEESDLKKWCYDGYLLYIYPKKESRYKFNVFESDCEVFTLIANSEFYDIQEEMKYTRSPFGRTL